MWARPSPWLKRAVEASQANFLALLLALPPPRQNSASQSTKISSSPGVVINAASPSDTDLDSEETAIDLRAANRMDFSVSGPYDGIKSS